MINSFISFNEDILHIFQIFKHGEEFFYESLMSPECTKIHVDKYQYLHTKLSVVMLSY